MKHITLIGMAALFGASMQAQVFTSGVEDWTSNLPDDFVGSKTNLALSNITQVSENPHGGAYAVRLENTGTSHARFTTQPVSVEDGQGYEVRFWARGQGDVRLGLFDDRTTGSGYAPYTDYVTVNDENWQEVVLTTSAVTTTAIAEFILSIRSTTAPEHLVVDDVTVTEVTVAPPVDATIAEIQGTGDTSPLAGQTVNTSGIISAVVGTSGYFLQDGTGPWSGIYVFSAPGTMVRGDAVTITGVVTEFNGQTQISGVSDATVESSGNVAPSTTISTADGNTEPYESVLVKVMGAECLSSGAFGQFTVNDGSGPVLVDDVIYAFPFVVGTVYDITGILQYAFSEWRILPRDVDDVAISTSIGELATAAVTLFPNPASDVLTIDLGGLAGRTEYTLTDATGRVVLGDVLTSARRTIGLGDLANGLYVFTLRNGAEVWSTRVQVQR